LNIHGAIDLETGATRMIDVTTVDALSTIALLMAIAFMYPTKRLIYVFLDNAKYHHAQMVRDWLARPGAGSGSTASRPNARTFLRSNACGD
jgi:hypothetical protein